MSSAKHRVSEETARAVVEAPLVRFIGGPTLVHLGGDAFDMTADALQAMEDGAGLFDVVWQTPLPPGLSLSTKHIRRLLAVMFTRIVAGKLEAAAVHGRESMMESMSAWLGDGTEESWAIFDWTVAQREAFVLAMLDSGEAQPIQPAVDGEL